MKVGLYELAVGLYERVIGLSEWVVALYEIAVGLYEKAGSLAEAMRVRSHSINRRLRLGLSIARATLSALVMRGFAFTSVVARDARRCLAWLSNRQADLKVGLYEVAVGLHELALGLYELAVGLYEMAVRLYEMSVGLYEKAGSLAEAMRVRSHSINRRLRLGLPIARATLSALVAQGSAFTSRRRPHSWRSLIPFGCGVAAGAVVTLFLPVQSIPGTTMPAPGPALSQSAPGLALSQPASRAGNATATTLVMRPGSLVPAGRPPANARSVGAGVKRTMTTAGRREPDQTSAVSPLPRNAPSARRTASPKLARYRGSLAVNSAPKGARVLINGVPVGRTPLLLKDVPVGSRVVRLELEGYKRWSSAVRVVANQRVHAAADLQPSLSNN